MKVNKEQVKALEEAGLIEPRASEAQQAWNGNQKKRRKKPRDKGNNPAFDGMCRAHGLPVPVAEYRFHPTRRWRFDFLFQGLVALEIQGGVWTQGHHSRGQGQVDDMEKFNHAQMMGYIVLLVTPEQVDSGEAFELVKQALAADTI